MDVKVRALLESQVVLLFQGKCADMLAHFDLPLAVQVNCEMTVLSTPAQFIEAMTSYRSDLIVSGVTGLTVRVAAVELPRRGRFRVWADIDHHRADLVDLAADQMIIYCREERGVIRMELLHYARFALTANGRVSRAQLA